MENVKRLTQAYYQAPWRKQLQYIVFFLVLLVMSAVVAGIYLNVTARAVTVGQEIQVMQNQIDNLRRTIADKETSLAFLTSTAIMEQRAREMGFRPVESDKIVYVVVPGYRERQEIYLAPTSQPAVVSKTELSPLFTVSLLEWLQVNVFNPSSVLAEVLR
jgi:cell division protein FtsL